MALSKKALASDAHDASANMTQPRPRRASGAETAAYIDEMVCELEALARSRGLEQLGDLLRMARGEAQLVTQDER